MRSIVELPAQLVLLGIGVVALAASPVPAEELRLVDLVGEYSMVTRDRSWHVALHRDASFRSAEIPADPGRASPPPKEGRASLSKGLLFLVVPPGDDITVLLPVALGPRLYLVPPGQRVQFCIDLAREQEPRSSRVGRFLLRHGDEEKATPRGILPHFCLEPSEGGEESAPSFPAPS
jgi:hypothetical protein